MRAHVVALGSGIVFSVAGMGLALLADRLDVSTMASGALVVGACAFLSAVLIRRLDRVMARQREVEQIWYAGYDEGYSDGQQDGRRIAKPVVVPLSRGHQRGRHAAPGQGAADD